MTVAGVPSGERGAVWRHGIVFVLLLGLTVSHFATDTHAIAVHDLLFKATFVPLILAGLWFRPGVALLWSALTSAVYLWHVFGDLQSHGHDVLWVGDIVLYNVITAGTATLSQRRAQALSQAKQHLAALEKNARALLQAEETLRRTDRLRAVGELAAGMAHEIRNPLSGVLGAAEVLRRGDARPEVAAEFWSLLESEIKRLDRVVANFLQFARPPQPDVAKVGLRDLTTAVLLLLRPEASRRGVACDHHVPDDLRVVADESLLRQILLNLGLNAVQAQPKGGALTLSARRDGDRVQIDVTDRGGGVPEAMRETLFDAYVTSRSEGTGLGLAVAARLAESMGGSVELTATGGDGSTFRVDLPAG